MLRAVVADELGPIENYRLRPLEPRPLGPNDVRIAMKSAGVSFVDVLVAAGRYQAKPAVPFTPGSECAGVIDAVGAEVENLAVGQKVVASGWAGMFADLVTVGAHAVWPMPEALSFEEASVFAVSYATAWHGLVDRGRLARGQSLLVLGAGGATGYAAVEIGRYTGAFVIASASSEAKRAMAIAGGAQVAVDSRDPDWRLAVKAANNGRPIDVVFDPVGGAATERAFRTLGYDGRHLVVGFPGGIASLPTNLALLKSASLVGVNISQLAAAHPDAAYANHAQVLALGSEGRFRPIVSAVYPLDDFAQAMREVAAGETAGRIVIVNR